MYKIYSDGVYNGSHASNNNDTQIDKQLQFKMQMYSIFVIRIMENVNEIL